MPSRLATDGKSLSRLASDVLAPPRALPSAVFKHLSHGGCTTQSPADLPEHTSKSLSLFPPPFLPRLLIMPNPSSYAPGPLCPHALQHLHKPQYLHAPHPWPARPRSRPHCGWLVFGPLPVRPSLFLTPPGCRCWRPRCWAAAGARAIVRTHVVIHARAVKCALALCAVYCLNSIHGLCVCMCVCVLSCECARSC